jgi:tRNA threonylcarbamoyladenosine biosynthesis protein TsaE
MEKKLFKISYSFSELENAARQFWDKFHDYRIFAFSGEMGAGKTTFIHRVCDYLHVQDAVSSPTFALINEYHFAGTDGADNIIYHLDWFRLKNSEEAFNAGMDDCVEQARNGKAICFIEWPEKAMELLPPSCLWVNIRTISDLEREMTVTMIQK